MPGMVSETSCLSSLFPRSPTVLFVAPRGSFIYFVRFDGLLYNSIQILIGRQVYIYTRDGLVISITLKCLFCWAGTRGRRFRPADKRNVGNVVSISHIAGAWRNL